MVDNQLFALSHCLIVGRVNLYPQAKQRKETILTDNSAVMGAIGS